MTGRRLTASRSCATTATLHTPNTLRPNTIRCHIGSHDEPDHSLAAHRASRTAASTQFARTTVASWLAERRVDASSRPAHTAALRARAHAPAVLRPLASKGGRGKTSPNLGEVKDRETSRIAAKGTGYSPRTLDKVDLVTEIAGDEAQPEGVRETARESPLDEPVEVVQHVKARGKTRCPTTPFRRARTNGWLSSPREKPFEDPSPPP